MSNHRFRSMLMTPASDGRMVEKAASLGVDIACIDLEDGVAPARRATARAHVASAFTNLDWGETSKAVRINGVQTQWAHGDVIEVVTGARGALDSIVIPKVSGPRDVWWVETLLIQLETLHDLIKSTRLQAVIENAQGLSNVEAIATCSSRLEALVFGAGNLAASQQAQVDPYLQPVDSHDTDPWDYARNRILIAARSAGIAAIDNVYPDYKDQIGYRRAVMRARVQGFDGKSTIHPDQVSVANDVFSPTSDEIKYARRIVELYNAETINGRGTLHFEGVVIDAAHLRMATTTLDKASRRGTVRKTVDLGLGLTRRAERLAGGIDLDRDTGSRDERGGPAAAG